MNRKIIIIVSMLITFSIVLSSCAPYRSVYSSDDGVWSLGFGSETIDLPMDTDAPLYIAGYHSGIEIEGVLDLPKAKSVWIDNNGKGVLLIGIDCIGVGSGVVKEIRQMLSDFCRDVNCVSVNVYATHTHAGIDTLGLWGPVAQNGKNEYYIENLVNAAVKSAQKAYDDHSEGKLYYGSAESKDMLEDSRKPIEYDSMLHQIRFVSDDNAQNGIRILSYAAHAESLRGDNKLLSADYPGLLAEKIKNACGDDVMFIPSAIGGLIMTRELAEPFDAIQNMRLTAGRLASLALSIKDEVEIDPILAVSRVEIDIPLDNTYFFFAKFLGILDNEIKRGTSETGYILCSELGALRLGSITFALIPGEIFPELVSGNGLAAGDPEALRTIAERYGIDNLLIIGLCNDELGYILPPSAYLLNEELPYIETVEDDNGENHYEETNSVGIKTAGIIASAFEKTLKQLTNNS